MREVVSFPQQEKSQSLTAFIENVYEIHSCHTQNLIPQGPAKVCLYKTFLAVCTLYFALLLHIVQTCFISSTAM